MEDGLLVYEGVVLRITGEIKDGKLELHDRDALRHFIHDNDGQVWITIETTPKTHSPQQNNYYRAMLKEISKQEIGHTSDELHEICKRKFKIESTKHLSMEEFSEYILNIQRWMSPMGFAVKEPL